MLTDPVAVLQPIMERRGARCDARHFQHAVNVTYHKFESIVYDSVHKPLWNDLPQQFHLLSSDYLETAGLPARGLRVLDVGCGTGLATQSLFATGFARLIGSVDLLDTSAEMLERAMRRSRNWGLPVTRIEGSLDAIPAGSRYDLIVMCSLLHHVPHLGSFLGRIHQLQAENGILLHLQDPNEDFLGSVEQQQRLREPGARNRSGAARRFSVLLKQVPSRLARRLSGNREMDYLERTNDELLRMGVIRTAMTASEIWAITDIHIADDRGVSLRTLHALLPAYELISSRSYAFFGRLKSELTPALQVREQMLIDARAPEGRSFGAIWRKRGS